MIPLMSLRIEVISDGVQFTKYQNIVVAKSLNKFFERQIPTSRQLYKKSSVVSVRSRSTEIVTRAQKHGEDEVHPLTAIPLFHKFFPLKDLLQHQKQ